MNAAFITVLFIASFVFKVSSTLPPNCAEVTCNRDSCSQFDCSCGTYKDLCGCCDLCHKCPDEQCNSYFFDLCSSGHECVLDNPSTRFEHGGVGHCKPRNATTNSSRRS
ncbi:8.6 kDa transglutaminase substrate [Rhipicephalus sanguineus]|uniref:Metastriate insulin growth factor binding protein n=1 Tax=Rhipicephalus sanguineus TaxID=34632 RepID=A0A9D4SQ40_RHISA|nr:8.6 kDa transglutaminase substrate [Rhipicephalus sanguineus]KAH7942940.1 hypothetical protein HPB52_002715 [Rhipicephalus sanguineus]